MGEGRDCLGVGVGRVRDWVGGTNVGEGKSEELVVLQGAAQPTTDMKNKTKSALYLITV